MSFHLFLTAIDVWLFRDGRPFDAEAHLEARSLFPPYPTVVQGALRSHHLVVHDVDLNDPQAIEASVGTSEEPRNFRMRGPFIAVREKDANGQEQVHRYFPMPADGILEEEVENGRVRTIRLFSLTPQDPPAGVLGTSLSSCGLKLLWYDKELGKLKNVYWIREDRLREYLEGHTLELQLGSDDGVRTSAELYTLESRTGIQRDDERRAVVEGALYSVTFVRPAENVGLAVDVVEGLDGWPNQGVMRFGGEGRGARFEKVSLMPWPTSTQQDLPERFRIYFATPTYFSGGWQPEGGNWSPFFDGEVRLVAVGLPKFQIRGGYDIARGMEKPARRFVPAGSVYFFEAAGSVRLRRDTITDWGDAFGFGQILIGRW